MKIRMMHFLKSKRFLIIAIVVFVCISELLVLNQNLSLKFKINELHQLEALLEDIQNKNEKMLNEFELEGKSLPSFLKEVINKTIESPKSPIRLKYAIFFIFTPYSCSPCVKYEIGTWNEFSKLYDHKIIQVIGITDSRQAIAAAQLKKQSRIDFPILTFDNLNTELHDFGIRSTPVVLFVDQKTKKCIYGFLPTVREKSNEKFTKKLKRFLENI